MNCALCSSGCHWCYYSQHVSMHLVDETKVECCCHQYLKTNKWCHVSKWGCDLCTPNLSGPWFMLGHNIYCCGVLAISDSKNGDWQSVTLDQQVCHKFLVNYICYTEDEAETLYNPTQFKDEEKVFWWTPLSCCLYCRGVYSSWTMVLRSL